MNKIIIGISLAVAFLIIVPGVGSLDATQTHDESSISSETEFIPIDNLALSDISNQNSAIFVKSDTVLNTPEKANFFNELLLDGNIIVSESKEAMELIDDSISHVFSKDSTINCIYYDPDLRISHCLSISSDNPETITTEIESWISTLDTSTSDVDVPSNFYVSCLYDDVKETGMGISKLRTTYYYWDEDDPKYNYYFVHTYFDISTKVLPMMSNNVDYVRSECQLEYADSKDLILQDTGPDNSGGSNISIGIGIPPSITINWGFDPNGVNVSNNSDLFSGKVDITQSFTAVLTTSSIHKYTSMGYSVLVDTYGPNMKTDYEAVEKHSIGFRTHGAGSIVGTHTFEYDVHIVPGPSNADESVVKIQ